MPLKKSTDLTNKTVKLIGDFQSGKIKPISTGIDHLDKSCLGGLTPSLIVGIAARSFSGKTYDLERIQRHILSNNPDVVVMNGNYELNFFKILVRDICQKTGKTMDEVLYNNPTVEDLKQLREVCEVHRNDNVYYQNEPVTPEQFFEDVSWLIEQYPDRKIVVTVDNLENILDTKGSQKSSVDSFLTQINRLKDMHWFISFIILNQLNDDILKRIDNPKNHKPIESDLYGSGQFFKLCDILYVKVMPWRMHLNDKFMVFSKNAYPWLEDFKIEGSNTDSFDPIGVAYYFYLKRRGVDIKDTKDVFAERVFERNEVEGYSSNNSFSTPSIKTPTFGAKPRQTEENNYKDITPITPDVAFDDPVVKSDDDQDEVPF
ncbi:MAG: hypothetical protein CMH22_05715 [Methylophaga sp.]|nr:hypothetical protein [Methylophaga sp.]|tara:strand:+ start:95092 stop:96213 length:1122 start_codon:yes stop_codon:yes gene_type:complete